MNKRQWAKVLVEDQSMDVMIWVRKPNVMVQLSRHGFIGVGFAKYNPNDVNIRPYSEQYGIARAKGRALTELAQKLADEDAELELGMQQSMEYLADIATELSF